jgi:hypothetical protein
MMVTRFFYELESLFELYIIHRQHTVKYYL